MKAIKLDDSTNIKCNDCNEKAKMVIEMENNKIFICQTCWSYLKELWWEF